MAKTSKDNKKSKNKKPGFFSRIKNWFAELKKELRRVNWLDKKKLKLNTGTVLAIILGIAVLIFVFDFIIVTALTKTGFYTKRAPKPTTTVATTQTVETTSETTVAPTTTATK